MSTLSKEHDPNIRYNPKDIRKIFLKSLLFTATASIPCLIFIILDNTNSLEEYIYRIVNSIKFEGYASVILGALWAVHKDYDSIQKYTREEYNKYVSLNILVGIILFLSSFSLSLLAATNFKRSPENYPEYIFNFIGAYLFLFAVFIVPGNPEGVKHLNNKQKNVISEIENYLKDNKDIQSDCEFNPYDKNGKIKWCAPLRLRFFWCNLILPTILLIVSIISIQLSHPTNSPAFLGTILAYLLYLACIFCITYWRLEDARSKAMQKNLIERSYPFIAIFCYGMILMMDYIFAYWIAGYINNVDSENITGIIICTFTLFFIIFLIKWNPQKWEYQTKEAALPILKKEKADSDKLLEAMEIPKNKDDALEQKEDTMPREEQKSTIFALILSFKRNSNS